MLIGITMAFFVAWAPINIFSVFKHLLKASFANPQVVMIFFIICHLVSMTSVILNPILYGFLNEHFKQVSYLAYPTGCYWKKLRHGKFFCDTLYIKFIQERPDWNEWCILISIFNIFMNELLLQIFTNHLNCFCTSVSTMSSHLKKLIICRNTQIRSTAEANNETFV